MSEQKIVILAGGKGLRLFEETITTPKPLVMIDNKPIIWHIMNRFSSFGYRQFIICLGHKSDVLISYFLDIPHKVLMKDNITISIQLENGWVIDLVDTGEETMTGGRIKKVASLIHDDFFITYADHISDIDIKELHNFHSNNNAICTLTSVNLKLNYGIINTNKEKMVTSFIEKPLLEDMLINAGYFVCKKEIIDLIKSDSEVFETDTMKKIIASEALYAYHHSGFWRSIDTYKDLIEVRELDINKIIINE